MGILASVFGSHKANQANFFTRYNKPYQTFTEYSPSFSNNDVKLYEQRLTRACIERIAISCMKLKPEVKGTAKPKIKRFIQTAPNSSMSWPAFLARVATILETDTTAFIVPSFDKNGQIDGLWPLLPQQTQLVEDESGNPWLKFYLKTGEVYPIERRNVCVLTKFQYQSDVFGGGNSALDSTLRLMDRQIEAQDAAIKNGAIIRFIGRLSGGVRPDDIEEKRNKFTSDNLSSMNQSGLMIYDNTWDNISQVEPKSYTIPTDEMERIDKSVFEYFGVNEKILTNDFTEEQWGAFYESKIEPFALQLGDGLTNLLYTPIERLHGNRIMFSANRLEYASNASKRNMLRDMGDRSVIKINEMRDILQMPPLPDAVGNMLIARGEYYMIDDDGNVRVVSGGKPTDSSSMPAPTFDDTDQPDLAGDDDIYNDNDSYGAGDKEVGK